MADKEFILPIQGNKTAAEIAAINDQIARGLVTCSNSQEITLSAPGSANGTMYRLVGSGISAQFKPLAVDGAGNYATFADIPVPPPAGDITVLADETNDGQRTKYMSDGTTLQWIPSVGV